MLRMQETALFEVGYRHNGVFDRNPLVRVCFFSFVSAMLYIL